MTTNEETLAASETLFTNMKSPVGELLLVGRRTGADRSQLALQGLYFAKKEHAKRGLPKDARKDDAAFVRVVSQLEEYFAGTRTKFDLELEPVGTVFQRDVWLALRKIPYGKTTTYGAIAASVGRPSAVRAVGAANGRNPIAIIVPCHRVIGQDGTLTGFAGGIAQKEKLLALEKSIDPLFGARA